VGVVIFRDRHGLGVSFLRLVWFGSVRHRSFQFFSVFQFSRLFGSVDESGALTNDRPLNKPPSRSTLERLAVSKFNP
jgi:hypothetical protein